MGKIANKFRWRRHHTVATILLSLIGLLFLWFGLAYGGLPRLWSHHEHKKGRISAQVAYTPQDIPGDPINLHIFGDAGAIGCAFKAAGWTQADPVNFVSGMNIAASVLLNRAYPNAPVSQLYLNDRAQDFAWEIKKKKGKESRGADIVGL